MENVTVYGFGSYFRGSKFAEDIDILLLHETTSKKSISFALRCKSHILSILQNSHITILSIAEESQVRFIEASRGQFLGQVSEGRFDEDMRAIGEKIASQTT